MGCTNEANIFSATIPVELFSVSSTTIMINSSPPTASLDKGTTVKPVVASRGTKIIPDITLDQALEQALQQPYDMLVLPGGLPGADYLDQDTRIHQLLKQMQEQDKYTAAICAAPKILANAKLLEGKNATSYPGVIDQMSLPNTQISGQNVVIDGKVVTSRGPATAMEFALSLIEVLIDKSKREEVANGLLWAG